MKNWLFDKGIFGPEQGEAPQAPGRSSQRVQGARHMAGAEGIEVTPENENNSWLGSQ